MTLGSASAISSASVMYWPIIALKALDQALSTNTLGKIRRACNTTALRRDIPPGAFQPALERSRLQFELYILRVYEAHTSSMSVRLPRRPPRIAYSTRGLYCL